MKRQLKYITSVCIWMLAMIQTSCDDSDGYSIGDIAYDWVTIHVESDGIYTFTGDTWGTMYPAASSIWGYKIAEGTRGMLIFNPLFDDYYGYDVGIKPEQLRVFLTKTVEEIDDENENEYADHPAYLREAWIAGGYMNMLFDMKMPLKEKHRVSLVKHADEPAIGDDGYIHLEYRYNTYGDTTDVFNPYTEVVCYNLNTLPLDKAKGIKMKINHAVYGHQTLIFENKNESMPDEAKNLNGSTEEEKDIY
ncbi:NigD-like C-terminal domain-containing protein [uncultured Phocaeicola sp.]|uniref:NigD1/NigD2 family lipoprotein n=1 Tax=uncultured Phocaeicola sp. TaxID=990718 RepID=UPI0025F62F49|nr:NigD-like C-terminal domain-containing protein [uncultured Phocaeicola sp.]